jgi:hypothetical protein
MRDLSDPFYELSPYWVDLESLARHTNREFFDHQDGSGHHARIGLGTNREVAEMLATVLKDQLRNISVSDRISAEFWDHLFIRNGCGVEADWLPAVNPLPHSAFKIVAAVSGEQIQYLLDWSSDYWWPSAFWFPLQMFALFFLHGRQQGDKLQQNSGIVALGVSSRSFPLRWYGRYFDLGCHASGSYATPLSTLEHAASIYPEGLRLSCLQGLGYSALESQKLLKSGLIGLNQWQRAVVAWPVEGLFHLDMNTLPCDEYHPYNPPTWIQPIEPGGLSGLEMFVRGEAPKSATTGHTGWIVDANYGTIFSSCTLEPHGLYGVKPRIPRDQIRPLLQLAEPAEWIRVRHYSTPIFEARTPLEFETLVDTIRTLIRQELFYRGQTKQYFTDRDPVVHRVLYGTDESKEPYLPGAAPRRNLDYETFHPLFQTLMQDFMYSRNAGEPLETYRKWKQVALKADCLWDLGVMATGQHYGIPTHGLDITASLDVALWFATNRYKRDETTGLSSYKKMETANWSDSPADWPVIYVIAPLTNSTTPSIRHVSPLQDLSVVATRAERQTAHFFMGSQGLGKNRLAEALLAVIRLCPGEWSTAASFSELFPSPSEDPVYEYMLELRRRHSSGSYGAFFSEIARYHP